MKTTQAAVNALRLTILSTIALLFQLGGLVQAQVTAASSAPVAMVKQLQSKEGLAAFAKGSGYLACAAELASLDQNLFRDTEYTIRAFFAERDAGKRPFSALVDSRKIDAQGRVARAFTNIVVSPHDVKPTRCSVMYEQTLYHDQHCESVRLQMAEFAPQIGGKSFGAITYDVAPNMTLTTIPVGAAQCVTVMKEVAF